MELADILTLAKAGYTRHEIEQMAGTPVSNPEPAPVAETAPETVPAQAQVAEPPAVPEPAPAPVTQPVQAPVQAPVQEQPTMAQVMESIAKLTSAVQANAIAQSVIPQGISKPPDAEDMLAEIIRPTFKER